MYLISNGDYADGHGHAISSPALQFCVIVARPDDIPAAINTLQEQTGVHPDEIVVNQLSGPIDHEQLLQPKTQGETVHERWTRRRKFLAGLKHERKHAGARLLVPSEQSHDHGAGG